MNMNIGTLLLTCALSLSAIAGYYSIVGLAAIFSAAFWPVVIMSSVLEISKLVVSSWLYRNWNNAAGVLKTYLTISVLILMGITSLGIFGFLSKAHVDQGVGTTQIALKLEQLSAQTQTHKTTIQRYETQLAQLDRAINQQLDQNRTTQALNFRRQQEAERTQIRSKLDAEQAALQAILKESGELKSQTAVLDSKLGALKYVAELFLDPKDVDVEKTVRWMILALVVVFDPLAVLMLIAANMHRPSPLASGYSEPAASPVLQQPAEPSASASMTTKNKPIKISKHDALFSWYNINGDLAIATTQGWKTFPTAQSGTAAQPLWGLAVRAASNACDPAAPITRHDVQTIVQKQEIDMDSLQRSMESILNNWLTSSLSVARPLDPSAIKDMIQQAVLAQNEQTENNTADSASETSAVSRDEPLRPHHPKILGRAIRDGLKQA